MKKEAAFHCSSHCSTRDGVASQSRYRPHQSVTLRGEESPRGVWQPPGQSGEPSVLLPLDGVQAGVSRLPLISMKMVPQSCLFLENFISFVFPPRQTGMEKKLAAVSSLQLLKTRQEKTLRLLSASPLFGVDASQAVIGQAAKSSPPPRGEKERAGAGESVSAVRCH